MTTPKEIEAVGERMAQMLPSLESVRPTRRGFFAGLGVLAGAGILAACGGNDDNENAGNNNNDTSRTTAAAGSDKVSEGDLGVAELAAGLEVLAVQTYGAALEAAEQGKLGTVPPAVAQFVKTAQSQHQDHLDAWNKVLTGNKRSEVSAPDAKLKPTIDAAFAKVTNVVGAAELALQLEEIAAATYLDAIGKLESDDAIALAGSIQPIDMQHASILLFVLGKYPVPNVFAQTKQSAAA